MYIEAIYHKELPARSPKEPRERFKEYYFDLHSRYNVKLDNSTFLQGSQYKFNELGYHALDECAKDNHLKEIDLMVISYWAHEFDPDYASCGTHFAYHYNFNCNMFDVLDQGSICTLIALFLIDKYHKNGSSKKSLCLALDQDSIPREDSFSFPIPTKNVASSIILSNEKKYDGEIKILNIEIWNEHLLLDIQFNFFELIMPVLKDFDIKLEDITIFIKRNTTIFRAIEFFKHRYITDTQNLNFHFTHLSSNCSDILYLINQIAENAIKPLRNYVLLIDEDAESLSSGYILLSL